MENSRYKNYRRRKFNDWRQRVKVRLPEMVTMFYASHGVHYSDHILLGRVITNINNPSYSRVHDSLNIVDSDSEMCLQVILRIQVQELFNLIHKLSTKTQLL